MDQTEASVTAVHDVGTDAIALEIATPSGFSAKPGQFVKLSAILDGENTSRFYTVSSPDTDDTFELTVSFDPAEGGPFSRYLLELEAGHAVTISGPFGNNFYDGAARTVVLAGGPGVGPALAIAERTLDDGGETAVIYRDDDPLHEERLAALAANGAEVFVLSTDEEIDDAVRATLTNAADEQVFVYGFQTFVDAAESAITDAGGDPGEAKVESFG
ncbi:MAG: FAD-dependent oxidoreductase [Natronomonas sp.]